MTDLGKGYSPPGPPGPRAVAIELFSGAGGMSLGFEAAGFEILVAVDNNPIHAATHEWNFPLTRSICADVEALSAEDILIMAKSHWMTQHPDEPWPGDIDCLFGGPSCQGFSEIGRRNPADQRNTLLAAFARLVATIRPKYFVMENVPGLLAPANGQLLNETLEILAEANYSLSADGPFILNANDFWVPQARRRVFIVGSRNDMALAEIPSTAGVNVTVGEALDDLRCLERYTSLTMVDSVQLSEWAVEQIDRGGSAYSRALRNGPDLDHGSYGLGYDRRWNRSVMTCSGRTVHRKDIVERFRGTSQGSEETISRLPRLRADGLAPTLRAGTGRDHGSFTSARPIHHVYPRVITVREAARLHSFPDWFQFHVRKWHGFQQIGNSVPPFLAKAVAQSIMSALGYSPHKLEARPVPRNVELLSFPLLKAAAYYGIDPDKLPKDSRVDRS